MMPEIRVAIGQVKRDLSDLVNRVAYGGERILLTSRGKPKAALVSFEDYQRLEQERATQDLARWQAWLAESEKLAADILERRGGVPLDVDALWQAARADLEARDDKVLGHWCQFCLQVDFTQSPTGSLSGADDAVEARRLWDVRANVVGL
jgi:prevent-host-death family protein